MVTPEEEKEAKWALGQQVKGRSVSRSRRKPSADAQSRKVWQELEEEFLLLDKSHSHLEL